mmetsp:Transcript_17484/g.29433  ORF Transcript_17484/g.29433 Transcript_17484/m.29433 type:complete len:212 (+) Transcript_17484:416-1051(+)
MADDPTVSGIMVQLPLPAHINAERVLTYIPHDKDIDGMDPFNIGSLGMKDHTPKFVSCTPLACLELIVHSLNQKYKEEIKVSGEESASQLLRSRKVCIVGRSNIVGLPLFLLLNHYNCQIQMCHSHTSPEDLQKYIGDAEIVVACCGVPNIVKADWVQEGAIVIDVGVTYVDKEDDTRYDLYKEIEEDLQGRISQTSSEIFGDVTFNDNIL